MERWSVYYQKSLIWRKLNNLSTMCRKYWGNLIIFIMNKVVLIQKIQKRWCTLRIWSMLMNSHTQAFGKVKIINRRCNYFQNINTQDVILKTNWPSCIKTIFKDKNCLRRHLGLNCLKEWVLWELYLHQATRIYMSILRAH
jgi:hypothetical protein